MLFFDWKRDVDEIVYQVEDLNYFFEDDQRLILCDCTISKNQGVQGLLQATPNSGVYDYYKSVLTGGFFVLIFDKISRKLSLYRDDSGLKTAYYGLNKERILVGNNVHEVYKSHSAATNRQRRHLRRQWHPFHLRRHPHRSYLLRSVPDASQAGQAFGPRSVRRNHMCIPCP